MKVDFDRIRREHPLPDVIKASGVDLKKNGNEFIACCCFHAEKSASFTVYKKGDWRYFCYGCGAKGNVIDFAQERYGIDKMEAVRQITGEVKREPVATKVYEETHDVYDGYVVSRPPENAEPFEPGKRTPPLLNPKRLDSKTGKPKLVTYTPKMVHPYRTKDGRLVGYVLRVEIDGKKLTPQIWWMVNKATGFEGWSHGSYPSPRPLYGTEDLHANPTCQVLIVEGEKCRDAAKRLMATRPVIPVSWMGGGKAIDRVNWKPLKGRKVIIWPDNDPQGWTTVMGWADKDMSWRDGILDRLFELGHETVKIVRIDPAVIPKGDEPKGWDIADAEKLGAAAVAEIIKSSLEEWTRERFEEWKQAERDKKAPKGIHADEEPVRRDGAPVEPTLASSDAGAPATTDGNAGDSVQRPADETPLVELVGPGYGINERNWRAHLIMKAEGDGLKANSLQNFTLLLQYDQRFHGIFAWNDFAKNTFIMRRPPWDRSGDPRHWTPRKMIDPDVTATASWLEYNGMGAKRNDAGAVIDRVAQQNCYNPVTDRLASFVWDNVPRLSGNLDGDGDVPPWLMRYFGAENSVENRAFGRKWMIAAVARAFRPGCKADTMLVIEGPQGLKKSTALRVLCDAVLPGLFTDEISDPNSKDAALQMQGAWIIEIAELDAFRRADITQIKAWLSRQSDRFRRPYGKIVEDLPRSCLFAGTVNPIGMGYLKDASGGRRFWPFAAGKIDLEALQRDAIQLWAEAVAAFKEGEQWWLDEQETFAAEAAQRERYEEDPYNGIIDRFIKARTSVSVNDVMIHMEIPPERRSPVIYRRIASHLHSRGWTRHTGAEEIIYQRPDGLI